MNGDMIENSRSEFGSCPQILRGVEQVATCPRGTGYGKRGTGYGKVGRGTVNEKAKAFAFINFLSEVGYKVRRPFADYLGDQTGLYELRPKPSRVIYFFCDKNKIVLLHAFIKKTKAIPEKDLKIALDRKENCDVLFKFNKAEFEE